MYLFWKKYSVILNRKGGGIEMKCQIGWNEGHASKEARGGKRGIW